MKYLCIETMKIIELKIWTNDLAGTERFYSRQLGFQKQDKNSEEVSYQVGTTRLSFQASSDTQPNYHIAFNIASNQIEDALDWIRGRVSLIEIPDGELIVDFTGWKAKSFYFWDNNGNILEFIARSGLQINNTPPFDPSHILSVSEIGLPVDHVGDISAWFQKEYGFPVFSRQEPKENFIALGDDEGLLLLVPEGRNWYPTNHPSVKSGTKMRVMQGSRVFDLSFTS